MITHTQNLSDEQKNTILNKINELVSVRFLEGVLNILNDKEKNQFKNAVDKQDTQTIDSIIKKYEDDAQKILDNEIQSIVEDLNQLN